MLKSQVDSLKTYRVMTPLLMIFKDLAEISGTLVASKMMLSLKTEIQNFEAIQGTEGMYFK